MDNTSNINNNDASDTSPGAASSGQTSAGPEANHDSLPAAPERPLFRVGTVAAAATAVATVVEAIHPPRAEADTVAALSCSLNVVTLPDTNVNSITSVALTLSNDLGSGSVSVTGRSISGADADSFASAFASGTVIASSQTAPLGVTFLPTSSGAHSATLWINYTSSYGSNSLPISLQGTGVSSGGSGVAADTSDPGFTSDSDGDTGDSSDSDCGCCTSDS